MAVFHLLIDPCEFVANSILEIYNSSMEAWQNKFHRKKMLSMIRFQPRCLIALIAIKRGGETFQDVVENTLHLNALPILGDMEKKEHKWSVHGFIRFTGVWNDPCLEHMYLSLQIRGKGVGILFLKEALEMVRTLNMQDNHGNVSSFIFPGSEIIVDLFCKPSLEKFYPKNGFKLRPCDASSEKLNQYVFHQRLPNTSTYAMGNAKYPTFDITKNFI